MYLAITLTKVLEYGLIALGAFFIGVVFVLLFVAPGEKVGCFLRTQKRSELNVLCIQLMYITESSNLTAYSSASTYDSVNLVFSG